MIDRNIYICNRLCVLQFFHTTSFAAAIAVVPNVDEPALNVLPFLQKKVAERIKNIQKHSGSDTTM